MIEGSQCWYAPTIHNFRLYNLPELKYASGEGIKTSIPHVINKLNANDKNICFGDELYVDTACMVQVDIYNYFK